jgi:transcription elongation GreA/GreB family factor
LKKHREIKKRAYEHCREFVSNRLSRISKQIQEVQESLTSETKSSAGDKHETGRAMLQLEREKLGNQLAESEKMQELLHRVRPDSLNSMGGLGALVETEDRYYYIAISAGAITTERLPIYCISPATPIGQLLLGKTTGESFLFNGNAFSVLSIS